jgi:uncharacterized protein (TIGR00255 family)
MSRMFSMTGHGVGAADLGRGRVVAEIRAVNHRYLDLRVKLPVELAEHTGAVEDRARRSLVRGRADLVARVEGDVAGPLVLDKARARAAFAQLCELRDELRSSEPVPLASVLSMPDLFVRAEAPTHEATRAAVELACERALEAVWSMRAREGDALAQDLEKNLDALEAGVSAAEARAPAAVHAHREKLRRRIERLSSGQEPLDPGRLEHEVALFADRTDVAEELARLRSHLAQTRSLLAGTDDQAGRRLDFLLQEMVRETNTLGSKSADSDLSGLVVEMKLAVSRMREQAQNVV